jgi:serine/threonine-protein kinase
VAIDARFSFAGGASATPSARIAIGPDGSIYVADTLAHRVRRVAPSGIVTTVAGTGERGTEGDGGPATEARLDGPSDVAVASDGTIYIADTGNSCVRAVDPAGILRTVAGRCGERGASGDGGAPEDALLDMPLGIDVDARGRLFIADTHNHRVRLVEPRQP